MLLVPPPFAVSHRPGTDRVGQGCSRCLDAARRTRRPDEAEAENAKAEQEEATATV
jgi:hypothetical protein